MRLTRRGRIVAAVALLALFAALLSIADPAGPCDAAPSTIAECWPALEPVDQ